MTPRFGFPEQVKHRIPAFGLPALHQGLPKTDFFDFIRFDTVLTNMLNTIS
jgi:hypothetical protein